MMKEYNLLTQGKDKNAYNRLYREYQKNYILYDLYPGFLLFSYLKRIPRNLLANLPAYFTDKLFSKSGNYYNDLPFIYQIPKGILGLITDMYRVNKPYITASSSVYDSYMDFYKSTWMSMWDTLNLMDYGSGLSLNILSIWFNALRDFLVRNALGEQERIIITNQCDRIKSKLEEI
nr:MAG TPA: hypothetical protein [Caudoviricetes sp.]